MLERDAMDRGRAITTARSVVSCIGHAIRQDDAEERQVRGDG